MLCQPSRVTAHSTPAPGFPQRTTILIKLDATVVERERQLGGGGGGSASGSVAGAER